MRAWMLGVAALALAASVAVANATARAGSPNSTNECVNERGQSYGTVRQRDPQPDLIAVVGHDQAGHEVEGYAHRDALFRDDQPATPAEALRMQAADHGRDIPVYAADGVSVVGSFHVTGANE